MAEVLILEDEELLRASMVRGLAKLEGIDVVDAGTVAEAIRIFRREPPSLIIADLDLPDGSGLQLLQEIDRSGLCIPVIFVSAYLDELREWIPRRPDIEMRAKPFELETIRRLVRERLAWAREGSRRPFTVDDYVELACMGRQAVLIKLEDSERLIGEIYVRSGEIWSAIDPSGRGTEALERLRASAGRVDVEPVTQQVSRDIPPLEREPEPEPQPEPEPEIVIEPVVEAEPQPEPADPAALKELALEAILAKDYAAAISAYERALALLPDDAIIRSNLDRLKRLVERTSA